MFRLEGVPLNLPRPSSALGAASPETLTALARRRAKEVDASSRHVGVMWDPPRRRWTAVLCVGNRRAVHIAQFDDETDAAVEYDRVAWIGRSRDAGHRGRWHHKRRWHRGHGEFFRGELDEIDLLRHALPNDLVATIHLADSSGKFGSVGNLPTAAGRAPCLVELGEMIAENPEGAPFAARYAEVISALEMRREREARRLLEQLVEESEVDHDLVTHINLQVTHVIHHHAERCLSLRNLRAGAGML